MKNIIFFITLLFLFQCQSKIDESSLIKLFDPNFKVNYEELSDLGFKPVNVDNFMLEKTINDTLIYFDFGDAGEIHKRSKPIGYYINIPIKEISDFESIVKNNNSIIVATKDELLVYFIVKNISNRLFFTCSLDKIDSSKITINFDYPEIEF